MASTMLTMSDLYVEIVRMLDGDDPEVSDISSDSMSRLVSIAQRRIYRDVRCRWNEKEFTTTTVTNNLAPLPADFESPSIAHFGRQALIPVDETVIQDYYASTGSKERYIAVAGSNFTFWPPISDGVALLGRYYARLPDLTDANIATNALFQNADDLFVYAALVESTPFFGPKDQMATWEAKYESIVETLNLHNHRAAYGVGRMKLRPSAGICGGFRGRSA